MTVGLVLHAHPDDEILFSGALMLARPHWEWIGVSLTAGPRVKQYRGINLGHRDEWRVLTIREFRQWRDSVARLGLEPDVVVTHNLVGEYGHPHHMAVHRIAHELFPRVWDFAPSMPTSVGRAPTQRLTSIPVTPAKREWFVEVYGQSVFDELAANQPGLMEWEAEVFSGPAALPG